MEEEDVGRSKRSHDPNQPAHVTGPGAELTQVKPGNETSLNFRRCTENKTTQPDTHTCTQAHTCMCSRLVCLPRGVGGSNEEINHHPVTHVETVLHRPEERPNSLMTTE